MPRPPHQGRETKVDPSQGPTIDADLQQALDGSRKMKVGKDQNRAAFRRSPQPRHMDQPLLILDLDETLICGTEQELPSPPDFRVAHYAIYRRPHLMAFLDYCFSDFAVAVWTSSSHSYASQVAAHLFRGRNLLFLWTAERCTQRYNRDTAEHYALKNLRKIRQFGISLERVLMVDDSPEQLERNYGNHIRIIPFEGDPMDQELPRLADYLRRIRNEPNYRAIEKRHWRTTSKPAKAE